MFRKDERSMKSMKKIGCLLLSLLTAGLIFTGCPEEIAVFEGKDEAAAGRIKTAVDQRIADQRAAFEDYNPEEQEKLSDPVIVTAGKYVILCVSNDNEAAKKCIDSYTKG